MIKVKEGTPKFNTSLCNSCRNAHIMRYENNEVTLCDELHPAQNIITRPVTTCNRYDDNSRPSLYDMRQIAWTLETNADKKFTGFAPPKKEDH